MAGKELNMKEITEILRLKSLGFGKRKISKILGIHRNTISKYFDTKDNPRIENKFPEKTTKVLNSSTTADWAQKIEWEKIREEVLKGVPIQILHEELVEQGKVQVLYPAFWKQLRKRVTLSEATMVRVFAPGSSCEIDYSDGINIINTTTGEVFKTEFFVGVLCSSRYTFAEFTFSQKSEDFLNSHIQMFKYFGGCSQTVAPDNLKSAVTKAHRYDPVINPAYTRLAAHYGFAVVPARVRTPQDKAIVERTIQCFQRWFFMKVRNTVFTSLVGLNKVLAECLVIFNKKIHRVFRKSRLEMFENEKSFLMPLPKDTYFVSTYSKALLSRDCHLIFEKNFYSAPYTLRGNVLELWVTNKTVEIYNGMERVAFHVRKKGDGKFSTEPNHYPKEHQAYLEEDIVNLKSRAFDIGPETSNLINELLQGPYPLRHLRRAQGILSFSRKYSKERLEKACKIANQFNNVTFYYIERVIKHGASQLTKGGEAIQRQENPNLRGVEKILH